MKDKIVTLVPTLPRKDDHQINPAVSQAMLANAAYLRSLADMIETGEACAIAYAYVLTTPDSQLTPVSNYCGDKATVTLLGTVHMMSTRLAEDLNDDAE